MNTFIQGFVAFFASFNAGTRTGAMLKLLGNESAIKTALGLIGESCARALMGFSTTNKVQGFRTVQSLNFIASGDVDAMNVPLAFAVCFAGIATEGTRVSFDDARFALSGKGTDDSKLIPGLPGSSVRRALGSLHSATAQTQISKVVGKNGLFSKLGITVRDAHGFTLAKGAGDNPFVVAYAKRLATLPEGDLIARVEKYRDAGSGDPVKPAKPARKGSKVVAQ